MKSLAIARVNLVRYFRDRSSLFSVFVLPPGTSGRCAPTQTSAFAM
jgi:hypothetical protein